MTVSQDFIDTFEDEGYPTNCVSMSDEEIESLPKSLPNDLVDLYKKYGRFQLFGGALNICHPNDLKGVLALVFKADNELNHKNCHAFAYNAFGKVFFWVDGLGAEHVKMYDGEVYAQSLIDGLEPDDLPERTIYFPFFVGSKNHEYYDTNAKPLFKRAVKKCGLLEIGECYGFFPALAMGGQPDIEFVKRTKAAAHFAFVAQTMDYNLIDIQGYGKSVVVRPIG